jgi:hypothetical protein
MAHTSHLNYSAGRDQEDHGLKPAQGKQYVRPYLKKKYKAGFVEWLK